MFTIRILTLENHFAPALFILPRAFIVPPISCSRDRLQVKVEDDQSGTIYFWTWHVMALHGKLSGGEGHGRMDGRSKSGEDGVSGWCEKTHSQ